MFESTLSRLGLALTVVIAGSSVSAQTPTIIFSNGWENRTELGCTLNGILDGTGGRTATAWEDFGPSYPALCSPRPVAEVVNTESVDGARSLQVNFAPDGSGNGPDFRIGQVFGNRTEIYARWYVKYSDNWVWASQDHKVAIFGNSAGSQDVYFNVRGNGNGGQGRITIHVIPADNALFYDPSSNMSPGVWHLVEIHIVSGGNGRVEAKLDGQLLSLRSDFGSNPLNLNTGSGLYYFKLDTTYNNYAYPTSLGLNMKTWFDAVAVSSNAWIGGTVVAGGGPLPPTTPPDAPVNLRIIR
jgi:hypothetical protein